MSSIKRLAILWFRNDLRLSDNLTLNKCIDLIGKKEIDLVLPFYCFDTSILEGVSRQAKLPRCSVYRCNFLIESVQDLRTNLHSKLDSRLYIAYGCPDVELAQFVDRLKVDLSASSVVDVVLASKEVADEEVELEKRVEKLLHDRKVKFDLVWDNTMIHYDDLPYRNNIQNMPDTFTTFRKSVEMRNGDYEVRKPNYLPSSYKLPGIESISSEAKLLEWGENKIPKKIDTNTSNKSAINSMHGGETAAYERMLNYFFKSDGLKLYKTTRNGLVGTEYSSKFSIWLSLGSISPRLLYLKVKEFESQKQANESTKHFVFELLWRDFFKFHTLKFGKKIFYLNGLWPNHRTWKWKNDPVLFEKWCKGETGYPFVDANMKELNETGWMSNRGRQNVASFLVKDLEIDWRLGAEYFESLLVDYDTTSNWCNWQYVAGVGVDPREDRYFNTTKQAYDYDEEGTFARLWLPAVSKLPKEFIYCPWRMSIVEQKKFECVLGKDYPTPCIRVKFELNPNNRRSNKFAQKSKQNN